MTIRRALFSMSQPDEVNHVILDFFQRMELDLPQVNLLQKNVTPSFTKAQSTFAKFLKVHHFKLEGHTSNFEDTCFVDSMPSLVNTVDILEELSSCIEMKIEFPFEHLLLDCMVFSNLVAEQRMPDPHNKLEHVERLLVTYLMMPIPEVRERILRRLYHRLRVIQALQEKSKFKVNNNYLLARFVYRKKVLNQFVNGMLINQELS